MTLGDGDDQEPGWGGKQSNSVRTKSSNPALAGRGGEGKATVSSLGGKKKKNLGFTDKESTKFLLSVSPSLQGRSFSYSAKA